MPGHARRLKAFVSPLVARVGKHHNLSAVQQAVSLGHIVDSGRRADAAMHQARVGIHPNIRFHPEVLLVALVGLVYLGVALTRTVLGRTWRGNQGGIDNRADFEQQALGRQRGVTIAAKSECTAWSPQQRTGTHLWRLCRQGQTA